MVMLVRVACNCRTDESPAHYAVKARGKYTCKDFHQGRCQLSFLGCTLFMDAGK